MLCLKSCPFDIDWHYKPLQKRVSFFYHSTFRLIHLISTLIEQHKRFIIFSCKESNSDYLKWQKVRNINRGFDVNHKLNLGLSMTIYNSVLVWRVDFVYKTNLKFSGTVELQLSNKVIWQRNSFSTKYFSRF